MSSESSKNFQSQVAEEIFLKVKEKFQEIFQERECKVIDIGSGDGKVLSQVLEKCDLKITRVVGTDKDEELLKSANENFGSENVSFHVFDSEEEIPEAIAAVGPFDLVTSLSCFHHVKNTEKLIENVNAILNADGFFYFIMANVSSINDSIAEIADNFSDHKERIIDEVAALSKDDQFKGDMDKILTDNGFSVDIYETSSIEKEFEKEELNATGKIMLPFLSEMMSEDSEKFLDNFFALLRVKDDDQEGDESGNKIKMDFIHCLAKKTANNEN